MSLAVAAVDGAIIVAISSDVTRTKPELVTRSTHERAEVMEAQQNGDRKSLDALAAYRCHHLAAIKLWPSEF